QQLLALVAGGGVVQRAGMGLTRLLPVFPGGGNLVCLCAGAGEIVQQVALVVLQQQQLVFVLAVDADEQVGQDAYFLQAAWAAIDPGAGAAIVADGAAQLALTV